MHKGRGGFCERLPFTAQYSECVHYSRSVSALEVERRARALAFTLSPFRRNLRNRDARAVSRARGGLVSTRRLGVESSRRLSPPRPGGAAPRRALRPAFRSPASS
eukprot:3787808-Prymnesium_polylepis.1